MTEKPPSPPAYQDPKIFTDDDCPSGRKDMIALDYFAGKALQGFCANPAVFAANGICGWALVNTDEAWLSDYCYEIAEKMLAARDRP